jgi:uncharacterized protein
VIGGYFLQRPFTASLRVPAFGAAWQTARGAQGRAVVYLSVLLAAIGVVEYVFAYGNPAVSAVLALALALGMALVSALAPLRQALIRCTDSLALVPVYILLTASIPWFFFHQQLWTPAVYSLVLALCLWHIQARRLSFSRLAGLHLTWRQLWRPLLLGAAIGTPTGFLEYLVLQVPAPSPTFAWPYLLRDTLYMVVFVGLGEELLFRGLIQTDLSRALGRHWGLLLGSVLFMVMHLTWRSVPELVFVFFAGGLMGYLYLRTGNLAASISMHAVNNIMLVSICPYLVPAVLGT